MACWRSVDPPLTLEWSGVGTASRRRNTHHEHCARTSLHGGKNPLHHPSARRKNNMTVCLPWTVREGWSPPMPTPLASQSRCFAEVRKSHAKHNRRTVSPTIRNDLSRSFIPTKMVFGLFHFTFLQYAVAMRGCLLYCTRCHSNVLFNSAIGKRNIVRLHTTPRNAHRKGQTNEVRRLEYGCLMRCV